MVMNLYSAFSMQHIQMHFAMRFLQGIDINNEIRPGQNTGSSTLNSLLIVCGFFTSHWFLREQ